MKMKPWWIAAVVAVAASTSSCVPVPAYPVDAYAGSLDKCLDIQGTYENSNYYRKLGWENNPRLVFNMSPKSVKDKFYIANIEKKIEIYLMNEKKVLVDIGTKTWIKIIFLDQQKIKIVVFDEKGSAVEEIVDLRDWPKANDRQEEEFSCAMDSWRSSYTGFGFNEGTRRKWREYTVLTKNHDGLLRVVQKSDSWRGTFGLYYPYDNKNSGEAVGYYRRVDLTVDDIRANNDKARKAIAQYDEVATSPPPAN